MATHSRSTSFGPVDSRWRIPFSLLPKVFAGGSAALREKIGAALAAIMYSVRNPHFSHCAVRWTLPRWGRGGTARLRRMEAVGRRPAPMAVAPAKRLETGLRAQASYTRPAGTFTAAKDDAQPRRQPILKNV